EERRAAVLGVIHPFFQTDECALRQQAAELVLPGARHLLAQRRRNEFAEGLGGFENDVADETVADDDIRVAVVDIASFGVADEIESRLLEDAIRLLRQLVALPFLFADREQADARGVDVEE